MANEPLTGRDLENLIKRIEKNHDFKTDDLTGRDMGTLRKFGFTLNKLKRSVGVPPSKINEQGDKLTSGDREEFLDYLRENPESTSHTITPHQKAILVRFHGASLNEAKEAAGVGEEYMYGKQIPDEAFDELFDFIRENPDAIIKDILAAGITYHTLYKAGGINKVKEELEISRLKMHGVLPGEAEKEKLLEVIRKNPKIRKKALFDQGFRQTLKEFFDDALTVAQVAAGIQFEKTREGILAEVEYMLHAGISFTSVNNTPYRGLVSPQSVYNAARKHRVESGFVDDKGNFIGNQGLSALVVEAKEKNGEKVSMNIVKRSRPPSIEDMLEYVSKHPDTTRRKLDAAGYNSPRRKYKGGMDDIREAAKNFGLERKLGSEEKNTTSKIVSGCYGAKETKKERTKTGPVGINFDKRDYSKVIDGEISEKPMKPYSPRSQQTVKKTRSDKPGNFDSKIIRYLTLINNLNNMTSLDLADLLKNENETDAFFEVYVDGDGYKTTYYAVKSLLAGKKLGKVLGIGVGPKDAALQSMLDTGIEFDSYLGTDVSEALVKKNSEIFGDSRIKFKKAVSPYDKPGENDEKFDTVLSTLFVSDISRAERYALIAQLANRQNIGGNVVLTMAGTNHRYQMISKEVEDLLYDAGYEVIKERRAVNLKFENNEKVRKPIYIFNATKVRNKNMSEFEDKYRAIAYLENDMPEKAAAIRSDLDLLGRRLNEINNISLDLLNGDSTVYDASFGAAIRTLEKYAKLDSGLEEAIRLNITNKHDAGTAKAALEMVELAKEKNGELSYGDRVHILREHKGPNKLRFASGNEFGFTKKIDIMNLGKLAGINPVDIICEHYKDKKTIFKYK